MAVKQLPRLSELPEPPDRLVGDQERFDVMTFDSLKAQKKMVNEDLNKTLIPKLNEFAVDVNASVNAAAQSERNAAASATTAGNEANEAAASAATAGTKAGEAAQSAAGAKTSETNAAASKSAAAKSATDAATAQRGAEAARDEARNLANVGYASEAKAGLAKVDGKTTQADAGGMITVKDVAIGGNTADLASGRGQIGGCPAVTTSANLNDYTRQGNWFFFNAAVGENFPATIGGWLTVYERSGYIYQVYRVINSDRAWGRRRASTETWTAWASLVASTLIGDGITVNNGIISVPEYQGATVSTPGTSGLVPSAAAGEQDLFLTGGGSYKAALTKITDSVASTASDTAASAKAVKSAYDRGSAGITAAGNAQAAANNALSVANSKAPGGFGLGVDATYDLVSDLNAAVKNGWYSTRPATANIPEPSAFGVCLVSCCDDNTIYQLHFGGSVWIRKISHRQQIYGTWRMICNVATGDARYAALARSAERLRNAQGDEMIFSWQGQGGQPAWLWGGNEGGTMYVWSPANLNVGYANNAGYAATTTGLTYTFTKNSSLVLPAGGTWFVLKWWDGDGGTASGNWSSGQLVAGGTTVNVNNGAFALRIA